MSDITVTSPAWPAVPEYGVTDPFGYNAASFAGRRAGAGLPNRRDALNGGDPLDRDTEYLYVLRILRDRIRAARQARGVPLVRPGLTPHAVLRDLERELQEAEDDDVETPRYRPGRRVVVKRKLREYDSD